MRTLLACFLALVAFGAKGALPSILRNPLTTNQITIGAGLDISAGSVLSVTTASEQNLGTIAGTGTATLSNATNLYRAIFSGSTFNIDLPASPANGGYAQIIGTNTSGGIQIGTIKVATVTTALFREELKSSVTTITNGTGAAFTVSFRASNGAWSRVDASGDNLSIGILSFKNYLKFNFPRRIDGGGCTYPNTNDFTAVTFMVPRFSGTSATNGNWCRFAIRVPNDIDTTVEPRASLTIRLSAADTGAQIYNIGFASVVNSAISTAVVGTWVKLDIPADASGSIDDVESVSGVTLTGWAAGLTPNQWWVIELNRAGATDTSTVASDFLELEIEYQISQ